MLAYAIILIRTLNPTNQRIAFRVKRLGHIDANTLGARDDEFGPWGKGWLDINHNGWGLVDEFDRSLLGGAEIIVTDIERKCVDAIRKGARPHVIAIGCERDTARWTVWFLP